MKVQNDNLKNLDEQMRRKINLKENEIENINKIYDKRIEEANTLGDEKYVESLDRNKQRIVLANKDYEEKLKFYQDSLAQAKTNIELEENKAVEVSKDKQHNLKVQAEDKYSKIYSNARENEEALFHKSQNDARELDQKSRHERLAHEGRSKQDLASFSSSLTLSTREQGINLKKQLESEQLGMTKALMQNKMDTQTRLAETSIKNKRLEQEQARVQEEQIKNLDQYQAELIRQKQADFQVRYKQLTEEHQAVLNGLTAKLNKATKEAIEVNVKEKKTIADVSNDPFYQLELLKPTMSEDSKNYYVHLEIPPHEKENVHLMAHGREIRLTMSKKYNSSIEDYDGSFNRTAKTQLYSKEFPTTDIMNQKQISQKYENGILSFKIAKL